MADWFVDASATDNTGTGAWNDPKKTVFADGAISGTAAEPASANGDTIFVLSTSGTTHLETWAANTTLTAGASNITTAAPTEIISVDSFNSGNPTTLSTGANRAKFQTTTGTTYIRLAGVVRYTNIIFEAAGSIHAYAGNDFIGAVGCHFEITGTGTGSTIGVAQTGVTFTTIDCTFQFANAGQGLTFSGNSARWDMLGGSIAAAGTVPTNVVPSSATGCSILLQGVDLSNCNGNFLASGLWGAGIEGALITMRGCKLHASLTINATTINTNTCELVVDNCHADDTIRSEKHGFPGVFSIDTALNLSGGWSDAIGDTAALCHELAPTADCSRGMPIDGPWLMAYAATGSTTFTVECIHDYASLTEQDVWLEFFYIGSATILAYSLDTTMDFVRSSGNETALTTSSKTGTDWLGTEPTTGTTQYVKLATTVNPLQAGYYMARVMLGKYESGRSFFYDPKVVAT